MWWHSTFHQVISPRAREGGPWDRCQAEISTWNSIIYICTRALHSFLFHVHQLPKANFTLSIQRSLCLPHTLPHLLTRFTPFYECDNSSILSTCPNHPHTLIYCTRQLLFDSSSSTHLFIPISIHSWHFQPNFSTTSSLEHPLFISQQFIPHASAP